MPTLDWIGKKAVQNHHNEIPFKLIRTVPELSLSNNSEISNSKDNLIVQGDNLHALKALLPYYAGQVKCICIDPPYNTGNEGWAYNDNVNSPEMKEWLNKVVGKEGDDLSRHDKWLCMMYPRLQLLRKFLREDGVIFVNIDDNEQHHLRMLMDEIFGANSYIGTIHWKRSESQNNSAKHFSVVGEFILCYSKTNKKNIMFKSLPLTEKAKKEYRYKDEKGFFRRGTIIDNTRGKNTFSVVSPKNKEIIIKSIRNPIWFKEMEKEQLIYWTDTNKPYLKIYQKDIIGQRASNWFDNTGVNEDAAEQITRIGLEFSFSKPYFLIKQLITLVTTTNSNDLILDSFAGSGTTGHSVLQLNSEDGGNRRFILVEMEEKICKDITAERVKRVINGYEYTKANGEVVKVDGLGGGFRYCKLDEPLFDELGSINKNVKYKELASHIIFSETGIPITEGQEEHFPLIGIHKNTAYYLLFNGVLGDKSVNGGNIVTRKTLSLLPEFDGEKVLFAAGSRLNPQRLKKEYNIIFKQTPYEIKVI